MVSLRLSTILSSIHQIPMGWAAVASDKCGLRHNRTAESSGHASWQIFHQPIWQWKDGSRRPAISGIGTPAISGAWRMAVEGATMEPKILRSSRSRALSHSEKDKKTFPSGQAEIKAVCLGVEFRLTKQEPGLHLMIFSGSAIMTMRIKWCLSQSATMLKLRLIDRSH